MSGQNGTTTAGRAPRRVAGIGLTLALAAGLATTIPGGSAEAASAELTAFADCAEFSAHMRALAEPDITAYGLGGDLVYKTAPVETMEGAPAPVADARSGSAPDAAVGNGPTGTNVQERGVDEPDIAKLDGERVLTLYGGQLTVVDASQDQPRLQARVTFSRGQYPNELLVLDKHRVLVLGTGYDLRPDAVDDGPASRTPALARPQYHRPSTPYVVLTLLDLSEPTSPRVMRTERITGRYITSRLSDGVARVVLGSQPRIAFSYPRDGEPEALALARNRRALAEADAKDFLPAREILDRTGKVVHSGPLMGCSAVSYPTVRSGLGIISVLTLDTTRGGSTFREGRARGVVSNGELVYSSSDRLYIGTTERGWNAPRRAGIRPERDRTHTHLHAFNVTGRRDSPYVGSGSVPGYLLGRWALSEHQGRLRVATTTGQPWAPPDEVPNSQSSVIVLDEHGSRLRPVGSVSGLGKGERIRAVRWFANLAAVVTFRQTDPLYLVDLSEPNQPRVTGELKIPGYSAYLHPVGDDRLLGIGQDADPEGRVTGLQVSYFDIANLAQPTRTAAIGYGQGYTTVEHDARAFTYLPDRRLAVLPAWVTQQVPCPPDAQCTSADGQPTFVGQIRVPAALGITVGADGRLSKTGKFLAEATVLRVLPLGDRLAAITTDAVVLLDTDSFTPIGSVRTRPEAPKG